MGVNRKLDLFTNDHEVILSLNSNEYTEITHARLKQAYQSVRENTTIQMDKAKVGYDCELRPAKSNDLQQVEQS